MKPEGWAIATVADLFDIQLGKMLNKEATETPPKFPYLGNREVQWGRFDLSDLREMHFSDDERKKFMLRPGDLLICEGGEVGRAALWRGDFECYFQKALHRLRPREGRVGAEYMLHFMRFAANHGRLADFTSQSSIAHLTREKLAQVEVPHPPLPEQRKIAAILSSVDDAIEATQAVIDQLHVVKKAMMAELLTRGLPGRHTRFKQTEIGEVPEGWNVLQGEKLFSLFGGYGPSDIVFDDSGAALFLKVDDFNNPANRCGLRDAALRYDPKRNQRIRTYQPGHIVFPKRGAAILKNRVQVLRALATVDPNLMVLAPGEHIDAEFFAYQMHYIGLHNLADNSGIPQINNKHLYPNLFAVPPLSEQQQIRAALSTTDDRADAELINLQSVKALKSALSSALLTGEIRVQPDEATP